MHSENKMGTMPIQKLLFAMSGPMMISMLVQALYNIVDSMFVARLSDDALTAVSLAFPIQNLMIAVSIGICIGVNALLSRSLGEKNQKMVNLAAHNGIVLSFAGAVLFALIGIFGSHAFFAAQVETPQVIVYGQEYMFFTCTLSFGLFGQVIFARLLQSTGRMMHSMVIQIVGAIINIALDPVLIFGLFGFPRLEVIGAALATVIAQVVASGLGLFYNVRYNPDIKLAFRELKPDFCAIGKIFQVGLPSIIMQAISSVMIFAFNQILVSFTEVATAVFGVYFKLQSFVFLPVFGLNNGMVPIIAYNYGAKKRNRIIKTVKLSAIFAVLLMFVGMLVFQIFPAQLLGLFNDSEELLAIGVPALRTISLCFVIAGYSIVCLSVFQSLGKGMPSMLISIFRQLVILLPVAHLLARSGDLNLVWYAFPIAEILAALLGTFFLCHTYKTVIRPLPEGEEDPT